jgi:cell division protein FtsB
MHPPRPYTGPAHAPSRAAVVLRVVRLMLVFLLGAVLAGVSYTYLVPVLAEFDRARALEARVEAELAALEKLAEHEEEKLHWMRYDPAYLELQARDKLDLHAPGEIVVRFPPEP